MKTCPYCGKEYADDATICPIDRNELTPAPVESASRADIDWIEQSFRWLLDEFGEDYFLRHPLILPEASFFPDKYDGTEQSVIALVKRICTYVDVDPGSVEVELFTENDDLMEKHRLVGEGNHSGGAAGLYISKASEPRKKIAINCSTLKNPTRLVATIAHELGHVILLGGGKISREREDHEYLTDLLTVFLGFGIFTANSAFMFTQWQDHSRQGWRTSRLGYLSEEMFGYSLAAYAWMRGETKPGWSKHLALNVGHYFKQSLKHFEKGGQTSLRRLVPSAR